MTIAAAEGESAALVTWPRLLVLFATGAGVAMTETMVPSILGVVIPVVDISRLLLGILIVCIALDLANRSWRLPWQRPGFGIVLAFFGSLLAGWLGGVAWPNSGDEYSYTFLADTFLAGRLWDPPPPDPLLFRSFHVLVKDGRLFSPYPPGWSAFLVPFRAFGATWLATPLLTVGLGVALDGACRRLGVGEAVRKPALALVLLTPFTLFLGGSLFPQTMAAALVMGIVWAQLTDEASPRVRRKLLMGALFGVLLVTRYDVFAIVALVYAIDRLVLRRVAVVGDGLLVLLGMLPFVAGLAAFNAGVTGDPLQLTSTWAGFDDIPPFPGGRLLRLIMPFALDLHFLGNLAQFGGLPVLLLSAVALVVKIRRRTCRFHDFLFLAAILFYSVLPFSGDHQYGPRYWFWAWPLGILTIVTGLIGAAGELRLFRRRVSFEAAAASFLVCAAGAFCVLLVTTHTYIAARRAVFDGPRPPGRAIVLLPSRVIKMWPWQNLAIPTPDMDFTRNDIDFSGRVLYGRSNVPNAVSRACAIRGREVFRWEEPGRLVRESCP
jgi:hypothetical protein